MELLKKKSVIIIACLACFCNTSLSVMEKWVCFCHEVESSDCMTFWPDVPSYDTHCHNNYILQTDHTRPEKKTAEDLRYCTYFILTNLLLSTIYFSPHWFFGTFCWFIIHTNVKLLKIIWKGPNVYLRAGVRRDDIQCGGMRSGYQGIISQPSTVGLCGSLAPLGAGGEISFQFLSVTCILGSHQNNEAEERWDMIPFDYLMIIIFKRCSSASFIIPPGSSDFFMDAGTWSFVWTSGSGRCLSH